MADEIVTDTEGLRLIAWSLEGGNRKMADECRRAADEIERLREQVAIAHRIIGSEAMIWLIAGSNHPQTHIDALRPVVGAYWDRYGNAWKQPMTLPEAVEILKGAHK